MTAMEIVFWRTSEKDVGDSLNWPPYMDELWPDYMHEDAIANVYFGRMMRLFPEYQFHGCEAGSDDIIIKGRCLPVVWDGDPASLPTEGWDWALQSGVENKEKGIAPNTLCAIEMSVAAQHRGKGLSTLGLQFMRSIAREQGFRHLIAPVRPSQKHRYPLIPMSDYITWTREDGLLWDAWLRTHQRLGAEVIKPCERSMIVPGTVAQWRDWTGMAFPGSGAHVVPGALSPVQIDLKADRGVYTEANVWMLHRVD